MFKDNIRPYEISLWTLQDSFITVLKPLEVFNRGQIETPKCLIKNDGTQELSFTIPMYYRENGILIENPIWYNVINGALIVNLRKLKVIFNKGNKGEEVFEFVINKVTETHSDGQLKCEVSAEGLAFQELGKVGYKISLLSQDFIDEYNDWYNSTVGKNTEDKTFDYPNKEAKAAAEPKNNINYWCKKIFKNSHWTYSIQMDWSSYDGIITEGEIDNDGREAKGLRRTDKIYEEEYVSSWEHKESEVDGVGILVPTAMENFKEKFRLVDLEKSNIYNLTQDLAKTFGVYCKYVYRYDENYHIIGKECVFYNNFLSEKEGKIEITYPYSVSKITREIDSADIVTKMFVTPVEDDTSPSGLITIADVSANKAREDYILNFDYLYNIGTISQEQYEAIGDYERSMYLMNIELEPFASLLAKMQNELVEYQAQLTLAKESRILDKEQMDQAIDMIAAIMDDSTRLYRNLNNPYKKPLTASGKLGSEQLYSFPFSLQGIVPNDHPDLTTKYGYPLYEGQENVYGIKLWYKKELTSSEYFSYEEFLKNKFKNEDGSINEELVAKNNFNIDLDENGNVKSLSNIFLADESVNNFYYATFSYRPQLQYQNIYDVYARKFAEDIISEEEANKKIKEIEEKIKEIKKQYNSLLEEKQKKIADFENMMGPALKEGSWQAENYNDYGSKYSGTISSLSSNMEHISFKWDEEPFEDEQLIYYSESIEQTPVYYIGFKIESFLEKIKNNLNNLSFIYDVLAPSTGGSTKREVLATKSLTIKSKMQYAFIKKGEKNIPIIILTDKNLELTDDIKNTCRLGLISSTIGEDGVETSEEVLVTNSELNLRENLLKNNSETIQIFPRLKVNSLLLKTSEDELIIKYADQTLKNYYDYSVLIRDENYFITFKEEVMLRDANINKTFNVAYALSNASLSLFLDSLEVSKTNAMPQVSYTLEVSSLNRTFIQYAYQNLNRIVGINDSELKFEDVQGYISELDLDLDNPWEDKITIQNYKTKFEDLFSTIVASSEQMKINSFAYNNAAGAFTSNGSLKPSVIQTTINQADLTYAFQSGNLTIDEVNGIWARSDAGVVAMRGGGIFCATQTDSNGNWLWNTGIMPSGINASLITAGQLDTNLIKIYADDDLRLQLNADGLFAYKTDSLGEADLNQYVVHNKDGLFSTIIKNNKKINLVSVSWDGFSLRDENDNLKFNVTPDGNLFVSGEIEASSGHIGNWKIVEQGLWKEDGTAGITTGFALDAEGNPIEPNEKSNMIWVNAKNYDSYGRLNEFRVTCDGTLYCSNAIIRGTVSADSFIGTTSGNEIDQQLRNISITILDGTTFTFENKNYDGNITVSPNYLKFRIYTNALTDQELISSNCDNQEDLTNVLKDYHFYYGISETTEANAEWREIILGDNGESEVLIWEPDYLTFNLKSDIMYSQIGDSDQKPLQTKLYFKVEKEGKQRQVNSLNEISYSGVEETVINDDGTTTKIIKPYIYKDVIVLTSETFGLNKYITPMNPPSYTFIENKNQNILYEHNPTTIFSVTLTGFTMEEASRGYWLINNENEEERIIYPIYGSSTETEATSTEGSILLSDESEIVINGKTAETGDIVGLGDKDKDISIEQNGITIHLTPQEDGSILAWAVVSYARIPEGGNIQLAFKIDYASRDGMCFRTKVGSDGITIIMNSSSGTTLTLGDTETELSVDVYYGTQLMNYDNSETSFYYVWKKDGIALSSIEEIEEILVEDEKGNDKIITVPRTVLRPDIFNRKKITVGADDFGLKAEYSCDIYTSLTNEEGVGGIESAVEDYKNNNEWQEEEWPPAFYIIKQPTDIRVSIGETATVSVEAAGNNLQYQWYLRNENDTKFSKSSIITNVYSVEMDSTRKNRQLYCVITGDNGKTGDNLVTYQTQTDIVTLYCNE